MKALKITALLLLFLCSCGEKPTDIDEPAFYSEVGVWESGNYFLSLNSDKFLVSYIAPDFIDSGSYSRDEDVISCASSYFQKTTTYEIAEIDERRMSVNVSYTDVRGAKKTASLSLNKTDKTPAVKDSPIVGKSETYFARLGNVYANVTTEFLTYNTGRRSTDAGAPKPYPLNFYYIFNGEKAYVQYFSGGVSIPTGAWSISYDSGKINVYKVEMTSSGGLNLFNVTDTSL